MINLWIRAQDRKRLLKVNSIYLVDCEVHTEDSNLGGLLGEYKSDERALEVLDEIQKLLVGDVLCFTNIDINADMAKFLGEKCISIRDSSKKSQIEYIPRDCIVYEMPKE